MKRVLCFGDSNTWGYIPGLSGRYDIKTRWTGVLQNLSKNEFEIVEAGMPNRTCFQNCPFGAEKTGIKILPKYLDDSFDIVILSLGINDLQKIYNTTLKDIERGLNDLILLAKKISKNAKIVILSPAKLRRDVETKDFLDLFSKDAVEKSVEFAKIYESVAVKNNCQFLDLDKIAEVSSIDGLHFSDKAHKKIAASIYKFLLYNSL